jgi:hypothetical protein
VLEVGSDSSPCAHTHNWLKVEVCTGPGPVAQIIFGSEPGSNDSNETLYRTFRAFWGHSFFFHEDKVISSCAQLMLVTQSGSGNKSHRLDLLGDFRSCPLPEIFRDNILQTWHPISLYRSPNAKITLYVLRASVNNSFKDYWHLCIKRKMY